MVELSGKSDPFQHSFPNMVFIIPTIIIFSLMGFFGYKLYLSIMEKEQGKGKKNKKEEKKSKKLSSPPSSPRSKKEK
ncbi:uncharacterized protein [Chironomus tepperi]|uniref:uncharacterized protein isoform X3 n=1 Tax=Chironomus tepperi TaxID=113505 RepID=UPI00391F363E